jgi:hypothetical protein
VLDGLPVGEPFDWVDRVSIELTGHDARHPLRLSAGARRELTRWSDIATNMHNPDIWPGGEVQWKQEMMQCLTTFMGLFQERGATHLIPAT